MNRMKTTTPNVVPMRPVPASSASPPVCSAVRVCVRLTDAIGDFVINLCRGLLKCGVEGDPHSDAEKRHDEHGNGGGDDSFTSLVITVAGHRPLHRRPESRNHGIPLFV